VSSSFSICIVLLCPDLYLVYLFFSLTAAGTLQKDFIALLEGTKPEKGNVSDKSSSSLPASLPLNLSSIGEMSVQERVKAIENLSDVLRVQALELSDFDTSVSIIPDDVVKMAVDAIEEAYSKWIPELVSLMSTLVDDDEVPLQSDSSKDHDEADDTAIGIQHQRRTQQKRKNSNQEDHEHPPREEKQNLGPNHQSRNRFLKNHFGAKYDHVFENHDAILNGDERHMQKLFSSLKATHDGYAGGSSTSGETHGRRAEFEAEGIGDKFTQCKRLVECASKMSRYDQLVYFHSDDIDEGSGKIDDNVIFFDEGNLRHKFNTIEDLSDQIQSLYGILGSYPSASPSLSPSSSPSTSPSASPSTSPSAAPSTSLSPSSASSISPSASPSSSPSAIPSTSPSTAPSISPSASPSTSPSAAPSTSPSASPSTSPSTSPTTSPTISPSDAPSPSPTSSFFQIFPRPTPNPTASPTTSPIDAPSTSPSSSPSVSPSTSTSPSASPSSLPYFLDTKCDELLQEFHRTVEFDGTPQWQGALVDQVCLAEGTTIYVDLADIHTKLDPVVISLNSNVYSRDEKQNTLYASATNRWVKEDALNSMADRVADELYKCASELFQSMKRTNDTGYEKEEFVFHREDNTIRIPRYVTTASPSRNDHGQLVNNYDPGFKFDDLGTKRTSFLYTKFYARDEIPETREFSSHLCNWISCSWKFDANKAKVEQYDGTVETVADTFPQCDLEDSGQCYCIEGDDCYEEDEKKRELVGEACERECILERREDYYNVITTGFELVFGNKPSVGFICGVKEAVVKDKKKLPGYCCLDAPYQLNNQDWGNAVSLDFEGDWVTPSKPTMIEIIIEIQQCLHIFHIILLPHSTRVTRSAHPMPLTLVDLAMKLAKSKAAPFVPSPTAPTCRYV
jgi:hypothetical protein